jgi:3-hydroxyisobutyrate dehydrogenase
MTHVTFLGLGVMGSGMAPRLINAGFDVTVWNRSADRAEPLRQRGAAVAASPREAAESADVIIGMVADDAASRAIWTGDRGALAGVKPGALAIESSTLSPEWVLELARLANGKGCAFIDAPVTGSKPHAASGEVLFLVGGAAEDLERARPVLRPLSRDIVHLGPVGSGARMKLVNNFVSAVQTVALGEALAFSECCGLDPEAALSVISNGAPGSPIVKTVGARMMARDYSVNFCLKLMRKDLTYAIAEARRCGVPLKTAATAAELFDNAIADGRGDADFAAVAESIPGRSKRTA